MLEPVSLVVLGVLVSLVPSGGQFHAFRVWIRPKEGALPLRAVASVVCVTACRTRRYSATPVRRAECALSCDWVILGGFHRYTLTLAGFCLGSSLLFVTATALALTSLRHSRSQSPEAGCFQRERQRGNSHRYLQFVKFLHSFRMEQFHSRLASLTKDMLSVFTPTPYLPKFDSA